VSYILDANIFIQAKNLHYGLDFCPGVWEWLTTHNTSGAVFSIDKVGDELAAGDDELTVWAAQRGDGFFRRTDAAVAACFGEVSAWVTGQQYEPAAVNTFLQVADFYLVAHALAGGHVVVTHEVAANTARRVKIPNVCVGLGLRFMTPYQMLRLEQARLVLGERPPIALTGPRPS